MPDLTTLFWPALACLALLGLNLWVFLRREWESLHRGVDYAQLNYPTARPTIRRWRLNGRRITPDLVWSERPEKWELLIDGKVAATLPGDTPQIDLIDDVFSGPGERTLDDYTHRYVLRPLPAGIGPDLEFGIKIIDRAFYGKNRMSFPHDIFLIETTVPIGRFRRRPLTDWIDDYRYIPAADLARADQVLRDEIKVTAGDSDQAKIEKIVHFMRTVLINAGGVPKDDFRWMHPFAIFEEMRAGTGKGWCTQNAQIFCFFANRAGLPTRFVFGATVQDNIVVYNGHSWTECWLSEQLRWVYVDPQAIVCGVFDANGLALNSADLLHLCRHLSFTGVTARTYRNWRWKDIPVEADPDQPVTVPFTLINATAVNQASEQSILKYREPPNVEDVRSVYSMLLKEPTFAWTNFKRYLLAPAPAYSLLPTDAARNYRIRQSLAVALVAAVAWLVVAAA